MKNKETNEAVIEIMAVRKIHHFSRSGKLANLLKETIRRSIFFYLVAGFLGLVMSGPAAAQSFSDNTFTSGWTTSLYYQAPPTPTLTATATPFPSISPNRRRLTHSYFTGTAIFAAHLNSLQTHAPSSGQIVNIRFRYRIQALTINVGYAPLIAQGGNLYSRPFDAATTAGSPINHVLQSSQLHLVRPDGTLDTSRHPDFSCTGQPITLGYYTGNSNPSPPATTPIVSVSDLSSWQVDLTTEPCAPPVNPCCTPVTTASIKDQLRLFQPGMVGANYSFIIVPAPPYTTQYQSYVNYMNAMNPAITTFTINWTITDQGTGTLPSTTPGPTVRTATTSWTCTGTGCPPAPAPIQFALPPALVPNRWYAVRATPATNGPPFWGQDCPPAVFYFNMREIP